VDFETLYQDLTPCGGGLRYPLLSPAIRRKCRKRNAVPRGITGGTEIQRPGLPRWGLDARLIIFLKKCFCQIQRNEKADSLF
jgi:hypothetical protein